LSVAFFIKTTKTAYQLKSNKVTVASINLADELVIFLVFVDMSILLTESQWERFRMRTKWECRRCVNRDSEQFSKSNNSCV